MMLNSSYLRTVGQLAFLRFISFSATHVACDADIGGIDRKEMQ